MSDHDEEIDSSDVESSSESPTDTRYPEAVSFASSKTYIGEDGEMWSSALNRKKNHSELPLAVDRTDNKGKDELPQKDKTLRRSDSVIHTSKHAGGSLSDPERVEGPDPRLGPQIGLSRAAIESALRQIPTGQNPLDFLGERGWLIDRTSEIFHASQDGTIWMTALRALIKEYDKIEGHRDSASPVGIHDDSEETDEYKIGKMYELVSRYQTPAQFLESRGWIVRSGYATDDDGRRWRTTASAIVEEYDRIQRRKAIDRQEY